VESANGNMGGTPCSMPNWQTTPINTQIRNFIFPDFVAPVYQSASCCSSLGRLGFKYDSLQGGSNKEAQANNPFIAAPMEVKCSVQRRSVSGNMCGDGSHWKDFVGTGACGAWLTSNEYGSWAYLTSSTIISAMAAAAGSPLRRNPYCGGLAAMCVQYEGEWKPKVNPDGTCNSWSGQPQGTCNEATALVSSNNLCRACPTYSQTSPEIDLPRDEQGQLSYSVIPLPPMNSSEKAGCNHCTSLWRAFNAFPCSPQQGNFVSNGEFRVCRTACERLFNACGPPTHRGGMYVQSPFNVDTSTFAGDYSTPEGLCIAMWNPATLSVWALDNITLRVVEDDSPAGCVGFDRSIGNFDFDTQNMVFDYEAIRGGDGYCSTDDPLYNPAAPCADLQEEFDAAYGVTDSSIDMVYSEAAEDWRAEKAKQITDSVISTADDAVASAHGIVASMYALDDVGRAKQIKLGWPWETGDIVAEHWNWAVAGAAIGCGSACCVCGVLLVMCALCHREADPPLEGLQQDTGATPVAQPTRPPSFEFVVSHPAGKHTYTDKDVLPGALPMKSL